MKLETQRLLIKPLSKEELLQYILVDNDLETDPKIKEIPRNELSRIKNTITTGILPAIKDKPGTILFYTFWMAIEKTENLIVGDIRFKGEPHENGEIEIGYGTYTAFQGKGLMTEAVNEIIGWAFQQEKVKALVAETNTANIASARILEKTGFRKKKETTGTIWWRLDKI